MNFIISMILLLMWTVSGLERTDILVASIIFAVLYIPENYTTQKFKHMDRIAKGSINSIFGIRNEKEEK